MAIDISGFWNVTTLNVMSCNRIRKCYLQLTLPRANKLVEVCKIISRTLKL